MNGLRRAIALTALACFAAGVAAGLAVSSGSAALGSSAQTEHEAFITKLAERYDLREPQVRDLRAVLLMRDDEVMRIANSFEVDRWPREAQNQLIAARQRMQKRIEHILDEEQRARYLRDSDTSDDDKDE